jgi:hypothetical protein
MDFGEQRQLLPAIGDKRRADRVKEYLRRLPKGAETSCGTLSSSCITVISVMFAAMAEGSCLLF